MLVDPRVFGMICCRGDNCFFTICDRAHPAGWDPSAAFSRFVAQQGGTAAEAESAAGIPHSAAADSLIAASEITCSSFNSLGSTREGTLARTTPNSSVPVTSTPEESIPAPAAAGAGAACSGGIAPSAAAASVPVRAFRAGACLLCRDGDSCRDAACVFVHSGQRCRHGADVINGEVCSFIREKHAASGRADRAFSCVPCRHSVSCNRGATCFYVHPGQLCRHGGDVLAGRNDKCKRVGGTGARKGSKIASAARGAARGDGPASSASASDADADGEADDEADDIGSDGGSKDDRAATADASAAPRVEASAAAGAGGAGAGVGPSSLAPPEAQLNPRAAAAATAAAGARMRRMMAQTCFACRDGEACRDVDCRHVHDGQLCRHGEDVRAGAVCDFIREKHAASGRADSAASCVPCKYGIACNRPCELVHPGQLCQHGGDVLASQADRPRCACVVGSPGASAEAT